MVKMWLRSWAEIVPIILMGLFFRFSLAQSDVVTTASSGTTTSGLLPSNTKSATLQFSDVNVVTPTTLKSTNPRITNIEPQYGPVSGGTRVTISGEDLTCPREPIITVHLTSSETQLTALNCSKENGAVICFTPPINTSKTGEFKVEASCNETNATLQTNNYTFTYKPDPVINAVVPMESILAGGITQTIIGTNLDSVAHPRMWTGFTPPSPDQGQPCVHFNATVLTCRTQAIVIRSLSNDSVLTHPEEIKIEELEGKTVRIGFFFDGVTTLQHNPLRMFRNPDIEKFNPETQDYLTNARNAIRINVTWPQMNFSANDITVQIGLLTCTGVHADEDAINCYPPHLPKSVIRYGPAELNTLKVTASVGHVTRDVGRLHYMSTQPFHVIIIVMIAVLAFIFITSCYFGLSTFFGPRVSGCGSKESRFRPISDAGESTAEGNGSSRKDGASITKAEKRRGKRSGTKRDEPIECVAMEFRAGGRDPL